MAKSEVYSWRVTPDLKSALEQAARDADTSIGGLLEQIAREWLKGRSDDEGEEQHRLHEAARSWIGAVRTGQSDLSEQAGAVAGAIIRKKHARNGSD